jgi:hypothetical protein
MSSLFSSGNDSYTRIRGAVHRQRGRSPILSASHLTGRSVHTKAEAFCNISPKCLDSRCVPTWSAEDPSSLRFSLEIDAWKSCWILNPVRSPAETSW